MLKAINMEREFQCDKKIIFQMLEEEFTRLNEVAGKLCSGLEIKSNSRIIEILEFEKNEILSVQITAPKDMYVQTYKFEGSDGIAQMYYEEDYHSNSMLRLLNFKLMRLLNRKKYYRRANQMFLSIEEKISELN